MNKCKNRCSNYNCPWNSCYEAEETNDVMYEMCSCARYVDMPMTVVGGEMSRSEFREDTIEVLRDIAKSVESIADSVNNRDDDNNGCNDNNNRSNRNSRNNRSGCNGCNGFSAYDTSNTQGCGYTRTSGNYGCSRRR